MFVCSVANVHNQPFDFASVHQQLKNVLTKVHVDFDVGSKVVISVPFSIERRRFVQVSQVLEQFGIKGFRHLRSSWRLRSRRQDNIVIAFVSDNFASEMIWGKVCFNPNMSGRRIPRNWNVFVCGTSWKKKRTMSVPTGQCLCCVLSLNFSTCVKMKIHAASFCWDVRGQNDAVWCFLHRSRVWDISSAPLWRLFWELFMEVFPINDDHVFCTWFTPRSAQHCGILSLFKFVLVTRTFSPLSQSTRLIYCAPFPVCEHGIVRRLDAENARFTFGLRVFMAGLCCPRCVCPHHCCSPPLKLLVTCAEFWGTGAGESHTSLRIVCVRTPLHMGTCHATLERDFLLTGSL